MRPSQSFYQLFQDLIGQSAAIALLEAALKKDRLAPAYLFSGPKGVGQKLAALRFLEGVITEGSESPRERSRLEAFNHPDLLWVEPTYLHKGQLVTQTSAEEANVSRRNPPQIRLEQIRQLSKFLGHKPLEAKLGMVVIEIGDSLAEGASNALLKTLEEPKNGLLILLSSRPERLLQTIRSRCQEIPFLRLDKDSLKKVCLEIQGNHEDDLDIHDAFENQEIFNLANGSPGAFLKHLKAWRDMPEPLWPRLNTLPSNSLEALALARDLTECLDGEQQLWLIDWLQNHIWLQTNDPKILKRLERLRSQLLAFVQPRIAWEITLIELMNSN